MGEPITARPQPPTIKKDDEDDVVFGSESQQNQPNLTSFTDAVRKSSNLFGEAVEDSTFENFRKLDLQTSKFLWVCQLFLLHGNQNLFFVSSR